MLFCDQVLPLWAAQSLFLMATVAVSCWPVLDGDFQQTLLSIPCFFCVIQDDLIVTVCPYRLCSQEE